VQLEPKYWRAEIAENKIKWYLTVITIDYIDLKKTGVLRLNLGVLKALLYYPSCIYVRSAGHMYSDTMSAGFRVWSNDIEYPFVEPLLLGIR
jgi:hypothetical protein